MTLLQWLDIHLDIIIWGWGIFLLFAIGLAIWTLMDLILFIIKNWNNGG